MKFVLLLIFLIIFSHIYKKPKDSAAKYHQDNKERLQKKAREIYQVLAKEKKEKKRQYKRRWFKSSPKYEKQRLVEYSRKCWKMIETPRYKKYCYRCSVRLPFHNSYQQ